MRLLERDERQDLVAKGLIIDDKANIKRSRGGERARNSRGCGRFKILESGIIAPGFIS